MRALTLVLTVALAALGGSAASGTAAAPSLNTALGDALRSQGIAPRRTAAIVLDVRTGTPVYAFNSTASLLPASVEKLAVSYTALRVLGPQFRFRTELVGVGARTGRVWHGSLGLVGYAIKGKVIDLWFPSMARAREWGRRTVTITIYR